MNGLNSSNENEGQPPEESFEHACVIDSEGTIIAVTRAFPELLRRRVDQLIGTHVCSLLAYPHEDCWDAESGEATAPKLVQLLTGDGRTISQLVGRYPMITRNGESVELLKLSPSAVNAPVDLESQVPMFVLSEDMRIVGWTAGTERLTGISRVLALGRPCWEVLGLRELDGTPICGPECPIARTAMVAPEQRDARVRMTCADGNRVLDLSTTLARIGGRRVLIHRLLTAQTTVAERRVRLTPRQLEVLELLEEGLTTAEIASRLVVEPVTVKNHIQAVLQALGCHSRVQAIARARRLGLI